MFVEFKLLKKILFGELTTCHQNIPYEHQIFCCIRILTCNHILRSIVKRLNEKKAINVYMFLNVNQICQLLTLLVHLEIHVRTRY